MMMWQLIAVIVLPQQIFTSDWIIHDNEDCPECIVYTTASNFTSIISFESKVLLGAKNSIYEINFFEKSSVPFNDKSEPTNLEDCSRNLGQRIEDCHNYYKVILQLNSADLFICGTSAFNPVCGVRTRSDLSYSTHSSDGVGICPANPRSSTTYLKLEGSVYGFAGTERASSSEYAISLINLRYDSYKVEATTKSDHFWLNKPDFVYSFEYGDYVYFILKEIAVEVTNIEQIYSRVVRICKNDHGGGNIFFKDNFMTFIKARIYCSFTRPGQSPYDFNEIGGAYYLDGYLYGLFSGPTSVIETGSVLCRYSMDDIAKVFSGKAKYYERGTFHDEAEARPFTCSQSRPVADASRNQLMSGAISASDPVYYSELQMKILVVKRVTVNNETSIIANAGTFTGSLIRMGFRDVEEYSGTVRARIFRLHSGPIHGLSVPEGASEDVYVMSHSWVGYVPLQLPCEHYTTCQACQTAFPYCGWCTSSDKNNFCMTAAQCATGRNWRSPYDRCPALPVFEMKPTDRTVTLTENQPTATVELMCRSKLDEVRPYWTKESGQISSRSKQLEGGTVLSINAERYTDAGTYICNLKGDAGNVVAMAQLTVNISPSFAEVSDRNVTVAHGDDVTLTCRCAGNPKPDTTWGLRNGRELPEGAIKESTGDLKLIRTVLADAGRYYCECNNDVGAAKFRDIVLTVAEKNPPAPKPSSDNAEPFDYKKMTIIIGCALVCIIVMGFVAHFVIRKRQVRKEGQPPPGAMHYPVTYQEQMYGEYGPHTPTSLIAPEYFEEQSQFEWGQPIMGPSRGLLALHTPTGNYLVPNLAPNAYGDGGEPPPAYHAEIELHQPPLQARRPLLHQSEHFFTPVQRIDPCNAGYSSRAEMQRLQPGYSTSAEPGYSGQIRGPTPPARTNVYRASPPRAPSNRIGSPESGSPPQDDLELCGEPEPSSATDNTDTLSEHEYERIGLINSNNNNTCSQNNNDYTCDSNSSLSGTT